MNLYRYNTWFVAIVSVLLILRIVINSISSQGSSVASILIAGLVPIILLYISICLMQTSIHNGITTATSIIAFICALLVAILFMPVGVIVSVIISMFLMLLLAVGLLLINWHMGRVAGLVITIIIMLIGGLFIGGYGQSIRKSSSESTTLSN